MHPPADLETLYRKRKLLLEEIARLGDFRQGSLSPRYRKCGKPYCHCAQEGAPGHGPLWLVTRAVAGRTVSTTIPQESVEQTFEQIAVFHRFQQLVAEYVETNIRICDVRLPAPAKAARAGAGRRQN